LDGLGIMPYISVLYRLVRSLKGDGMRIVALFTLMLVAVVSADSGSVFSSTLQELPAGWYNDSWTVDSDGVHFSVTCYPGDEKTGTIGSNGDPAVWYFVPDGTDSLVVNLTYDWGAVLNGGYCLGRVRMHYLNGGFDLIMKETEGPFFMGGEDEVEVEITFFPPEDTWIGFSAFGRLIQNYALHNSGFHLQILNLSAVAYGDNLTMKSYTWGRIKSSF